MLPHGAPSCHVIMIDSRQISKDIGHTIDIDIE